MKDDEKLKKNADEPKEDVIEGEDGYEDEDHSMTSDESKQKMLNINDLFIGKADVYHDLKLATKFMVEDYCVLKYFVKGSHVAET